MRRVLVVIICLFWVSSLFADEVQYVRIKGDGTVKTSDGIIYQLFSDERLPIDINQNIGIFGDKASTGDINGSKELYVDRLGHYSLHPQISILRDDDSLYVRIPNTSGLSICRLINQNRNYCFATVSDQQFGTYISYSLNTIKCDSNSVIRISPVGFFSFVIKWEEIKKVTESIDSTKSIVYDYVTTKLYKKDTIRVCKSSHKELWVEDIEDEPSNIWMIVFFCFAIIMISFLLYILMKQNREINYLKSKRSFSERPNRVVTLSPDEQGYITKMKKELDDTRSQLKRAVKENHKLEELLKHKDTYLSIL